MRSVMRTKNAVGAALVAACVVIQPVTGQPHSVQVAKVCYSPRLVGEILECRVEVTHADSMGDTWMIHDIWDVVNPGPNQTIVELTIIDVEGNTTAQIGSTLPVLIGPSFSTALGLPGEDEPGRVIFLQSSYVISELDPSPLIDRVHVLVQDLCDDPNTLGCNPLIIERQTTAATIVLPDCNANGVNDATDIAQGTSSDVDMDGIPDDCQDCNDNGVLDSIDIANETSEDCNL
ncbi:MAG: hypothetical protein GY716_09540, partial [bacterium]|nr:hypothetical protein [bacterium]